MENERIPHEGQAPQDKDKKNNKKYYHNRNKKKHHKPHPNADQTNAQNQNAQSTASSDTHREAKKENAQNTERTEQHHKNNNDRHHQKRNNRKNRPHHPQERQNPSTEEIKNVEHELIPEVVEDIAAEYETPETEAPITEAEISEVDITKEQKSEELVEIIGVRFKVGGKTYYFAPNGISAKKGMHVIVETSRGLEFGEVAISNSKVSESEFVPPLRPVIRIATLEDVKHHDENSKKQDEAFKICNEKIIAHKLDMKLIDAQYTFDNTKLLFYFTSAGRVDFRDLVKDLASVFKTRIELRQIGIRDEAKLIGGLGICGRPLCCSRFLTDFGQVSIKMAKEQNLSLNSSKISGACGRLMCCLRYEYDTYVQEIKNTPPIDSYVKTPDGNGTITEIMPLAGKVKVRLDEKPDVQPKTYARESVTVLPKQK